MFKERVKDYEKRRRIESTNDSQILPTANPKVQLPSTKSTSNITPNSIVSLIAHDIRITPVEKERIYNYIYNKTKNRSYFKFDNNIKTTPTSDSLTDNGGVGISSLVTPTNITTTMHNENGTYSNAVKGNNHSLSKIAQ